MDKLSGLLYGGASLALLAIGGLYGIKKCVFSVDGGHRAIKFSRLTGLKSKVYREGWHLMLPYFEWPIIFDARSRPHALRSETGNKDLQLVDINVRVLYRPDTEKLVEIYRFVGKDYDDRVLPSIINEVVKTTVVCIAFLIVGPI